MPVSTAVAASTKPATMTMAGHPRRGNSFPGLNLRPQYTTPAAKGTAPTMNMVTSKVVMMFSFPLISLNHLRPLRKKAIDPPTTTSAITMTIQTPNGNPPPGFMTAT